MGRLFSENGIVFPVHTCHFGNMDKRNNKGQAEAGEGRHEHPLPQEISNEQRRLNEEAHNAAEHDMEDDAELTASSPNDDLDEGESARLGEDTPLI
jgi:hypothetical protein